MSKLLALGILAAIGMSLPLHAQERTAGSALENQMSWSALSSQIHANTTKIEGVNTLVNQGIICGRKGMVHAPGGNGIDSEGCKEAAKNGDVNVNITSLSNGLTATNTNVTNLASTVTQIINCNKSGQIFNGSGCVAIASPVPTGTMCGASSNSTEVGKPLVFTCQGHDPKKSCPAGYSGATAPIWGGKNGQSISYCFKN